MSKTVIKAAAPCLMAHQEYQGPNYAKNVIYGRHTRGPHHDGWIRWRRLQLFFYAEDYPQG